MRSGLAGERTIFLAIAAILGALTGLAVVFFEWLTEIATLYFRAAPSAKFGPSWYYSYLIVPLAPALGGLIVGALHWYFKMGRESASIADMMKWVAVDSGYVRKRVVFVRTFASAIFLGSGGSGGREGPIAQIGAALGSTVGQWLRASTERLRLLTGCGAAAAVAAAFNAPIAGVIFAVELVFTDYTVIGFLPIVISSVMATTTKRYFSDGGHVFSGASYTLVSPYEMVFYLALGIICGLLSWVFFKAHFYVDDFFKTRVKVHTVLKPAIGGLFVGLIGISAPEVFGNGFETMDLMLTGKLTFLVALALVGLKIFATAASLGTGGSGGIFAPTLFVGCMAGGAFGYIVNYVAPFEVAAPGAYAMVGLGSVMAAISHSPLTNILMGYELTGNYQIILPIMTSCIVATYVMTRLEPESIFTERLKRIGVTLYKGRDLSVMARLKVSDVARRDFVTIDEAAPFRDLMRLVTTSKENYFPVVDADRNLKGIISLYNIRGALEESEFLADLVIARDIATRRVATISEDDTLNAAFVLFTEIDIEQLPVMSSLNPERVVGMIARKDVMSAYNKAALLSGKV